MAAYAFEACSARLLRDSDARPAVPGCERTAAERVIEVSSEYHPDAFLAHVLVRFERIFADTPDIAESWNKPLRISGLQAFPTSEKVYKSLYISKGFLAETPCRVQSGAPSEYARR